MLQKILALKLKTFKSCFRQLWSTTVMWLYLQYLLAISGI